MKNKVINQTELQAQFNKPFELKRAVVAEIEYDNNTTGESITFINKDTSEELTVFGLREALKHQDTVVSVKFTVCSFVDGVLKPYMFYERDFFSVEEKIEVTNGSHFYYLKSRERNLRNEFMKQNGIKHDHRSQYAYSA